MTDIILFGIQGSGKGTQGTFVMQRYDLFPFVTGDELRKIASEDSDLGKKVKEITEAGHLVPNEIVMAIIENFMQKLPEGKSVLFDGIPRKLSQAESFNALMQKMNRNVMGVNLNLSKEEAYQRLITRKMCKSCKAIYPSTYEKSTCETCNGELITRQDDNPESIKTRLEIFETETIPVINWYKTENKMIEINGAQTREKVTQDVFAALDPYFA